MKVRSIVIVVLAAVWAAGPGAFARQTTALQAVAALKVKGRAAMTGYERDRFGAGWIDVNRNGCDTRDDILHRDLTQRRIRPLTHGCVITAGTLRDPYTRAVIRYRRGGGSEVDIDHVVALGDAWQKGAQRWAYGKRVAFANDPLNLLAISASANRQKALLPPTSAAPCGHSRRVSRVASLTRRADRLGVSSSRRPRAQRVRLATRLRDPHRPWRAEHAGRPRVRHREQRPRDAPHDARRRVDPSVQSGTRGKIGIAAG